MVRQGQGGSHNDFAEISGRGLIQLTIRDMRTNIEHIARINHPQCYRRESLGRADAYENAAVTSAFRQTHVSIVDMASPAASRD
jgi:hypothetical protein